MPEYYTFLCFDVRDLHEWQMLDHYSAQRDLFWVLYYSQIINTRIINRQLDKAEILETIQG